MVYRTGVDILQKKPKNAQGGINSAQAKFPESLKKKCFYSLEMKKSNCFFALNCQFLGINNKTDFPTNQNLFLN